MSQTLAPINPEIIESISIWGVVKWVYVFVFLLYLIFATIGLRQIFLMIGTLNGSMNLPLKTVGWIHLGIAVVLFLLALVVL